METQHEMEGRILNSDYDEDWNFQFFMDIPLGKMCLSRFDVLLPFLRLYTESPSMNLGTGSSDSRAIEMLKTKIKGFLMGYGNGTFVEIYWKQILKCISKCMTEDKIRVVELELRRIKI